MVNFFAKRDEDIFCRHEMKEQVEVIILSAEYLVKVCQENQYSTQNLIISQTHGCESECIGKWDGA